MEEVRDAEEAGDERRSRLLVQLGGRAELLDAPPFMTAILSAIVIASSWSCVT